MGEAKQKPSAHSLHIVHSLGISSTSTLNWHTFVFCSTVNHFLLSESVLCNWSEPEQAPTIESWTRAAFVWCLGINILFHNEELWLPYRLIFYLCSRFTRVQILQCGEWSYDQEGYVPEAWVATVCGLGYWGRLFTQHWGMSHGHHYAWVHRKVRKLCINPYISIV